MDTGAQEGQTMPVPGPSNPFFADSPMTVFIRTFLVTQKSNSS